MDSTEYQKRLNNYILHDGVPVPCEDLMAYYRWWELNQDQRRVALTCILPDGTREEVSSGSDDEIDVSTVFLGLDHNHAMIGPPVLFETLVFDHGRTVENTMRRYTAREAALAGHQQMVAWVQEHVRRGKPFEEDDE